MVCLSADAIEDVMNAKAFDKSLLTGRSAIRGLECTRWASPPGVERVQQPGDVTSGQAFRAGRKKNNVMQMF